MNANEITLSRDSVCNLEQIEGAVLGCANLVEHDIEVRFELIGKLLHENILHLDLDEEIRLLTTFARGVACEMLSESVRSKAFPKSCWVAGPFDKVPPYFKKVNGKSMKTSDVRSPEKSKIAMTMVLASILRNDQKFRDDAEALLDYGERNKPCEDDDVVYD